VGFSPVNSTPLSPFFSSFKIALRVTLIARLLLLTRRSTALFLEEDGVRSRHWMAGHWQSTKSSLMAASMQLGC
jgi:hypothetical protein